MFHSVKGERVSLIFLMFSPSQRLSFLLIGNPSERQLINASAEGPVNDKEATLLSFSDSQNKEKQQETRPDPLALLESL